MESYREEEYDDYKPNMVRQGVMLPYWFWWFLFPPYPPGPRPPYPPYPPGPRPPYPPGPPGPRPPYPPGAFPRNEEDTVY